MSGKIFIPKPCHENWNKMTPEEQGRHCAVCSKVVKDFTSMQKDEIIDELKKTEGEVCGRINAKEITPTNKKQKVYFLINGWIYRKAIYPIMALLGLTLVSKKAVAQTDYPLKGKVAYNDYYTNSKKITLVVKTKQGNEVIPNATVNIIGGVRNTPDSKITDAKGRLVMDISAHNLTSDSIQIEIYAPGYEYKYSTIKLIKDVQTVEIRMEDEMMIMGEMMYIPDEKQIKTEILTIDSVDKVKITKCSILEVTKLPEISPEVLNIEFVDDVPSVDTTIQADEVFTSGINENLGKSTFTLFPVPASDFVNITTTDTRNFNLDLFDGHGKKLQSVMNGNSRYTIDISSYTSGVYYVLITVEGKAVETKKILVTR